MHLRFIILQAAVLFLTGLTACIFDKEEPDYSLAVGSALPDFSVTLLDGELFSTYDLSGSETENLLIVFFNTDCQDCRQDLPLIQNLYEEIREDATLRQNTRLLCVAREEDAPQIRKYWSENRLTLPAAPQVDRGIYSLFASSGIPRLYLAQPVGSASRWTIIASYAPGEIPPAGAILPLLFR